MGGNPPLSIKQKRGKTMNMNWKEDPELYFANPRDINDGTWISVTDELQMAQEIKYHCASYLDTWKIRAAVGYNDLPIDILQGTKSLETLIDLSCVVTNYDPPVIKKVVEKFGTDKATKILTYSQYVGSKDEHIDFLTSYHELTIPKNLHKFIDWEGVFSELGDGETYYVVDDMVWKTL